MPNSLHVSYTTLQNALGELIPRPILTIEMMNGKQLIRATGLVDSGADVNVLPHQIGIALGLVWEEQRYTFQLSGNLANLPARAIVIPVKVGNYSPIDLAFAWVHTERAPLILGQTNFFETFNVCFYRTDGYFSIELK